MRVEGGGEKEYSEKANLCQHLAAVCPANRIINAITKPNPMYNNFNVSVNIKSSQPKNHAG